MLRYTILLICLFFVPTVSAKDWRGLIPLHSTRADAKRILGSSLKDEEGGSIYKAADLIAVIIYQNDTCDSRMGKFGFGWRVPTDSIGIIGVVPLTRQTKDDYGVTAAFKEEKTGGGFIYYSNATEGLRIETLNGLVTSVTYLPTSKEDKELRCPKVQECCWDVFPTIDEFEQRPRNETIARLGNLFVNVKVSIGRAVIVVSGPTNKRKAEIRRLEQLSGPLLKNLTIEPQRILFADGGYTDSLTTKLNIYPFASELNWIMISTKEDPKPPKSLAKP